MLSHKTLPHPTPAPCRVVDGATLGGFAKAFSGFVEKPGTLLLHLQ